MEIKTQINRELAEKYESAPYIRITTKKAKKQQLHVTFN